MKAQSKFAPLKVEFVLDDRFSRSYKKPRMETTGTFLNKSRDKEWYRNRAEKLAGEFSWS